MQYGEALSVAWLGGEDLIFVMTKLAEHCDFSQNVGVSNTVPATEKL